jgi:hypothetical protein
MKAMIHVLWAMLLIFSLSFISGCGRGEDDSDRKEEIPRPPSSVEVTGPPDNDASDDMVPSHETETPEITEPEDDPAAADDPNGVIQMQNEAAVSQRRMGIVMFTHEKHYQEPPDGHGIGCGECHHDEEGKPLTDLKPGDPVQSCYECHNKKDRPRKPQDISDEDWRAMRLEYYVEAVHENCIECHQQQGGPVKCTDCHVKN